MIWGGLVLVILGVMGAGAWSLLRQRPGASPQLPVYGRVPDFTLAERSGRRVGLSDLQGKVWVANFMYTHCPDTCPLQSAALAQLQRDLEGEKDLRLVSITVDPERDTPEVLARYAERFGAHPGRWFFLTGERRAIYRLAQEGFRLSVADPGEASNTSSERGSLSQGSRPPFLHSARFVLVDRQGRIRGYYGVILQPGIQAGTTGPPVLTDDDALRQLLQGAKALTRER